MRLAAVALAFALGGCVYADIPVTLDTTLTVVDDTTGKPISGASVTVYWSADRSYQAAAVTGADGTVQLPPVLHRDTRLGPRPYPHTEDGIRVSAPGYRTYDLGRTTTGAIPKRCEVLRLARTGHPRPGTSEDITCDQVLHPVPAGKPDPHTSIIAGLPGGL